MITVLTVAALTALTAPITSPTPNPAISRFETTTLPSTEPAEGADVLPLDPLPDDRLTVNVAVRGEGPFRFMVDTAADRSAVSRQLADRLKLRPGRGALLHGVAGARRVGTASLRGMQVASRALPTIDAPLLDAAHVGADGILGTDVLRSATVRFNFRDRQLLITPGRDRSRTDAPGTIVVEARRRMGRLIVTEAELDGQRLTVILDTGSDVSIGNEALRRALARRGHLGTPTPVILNSVTGLTLPANFMTTRKLDLGDVALQGLGIAFADAHTFRAMRINDAPALLLGMNALQAFESLTVDMKARKLRFVMPGSATPTPKLAALGKGRR